MSFYSLSAKDINGNLVSFETFKGKKVLIVNTASNCGFTPQYATLQDLYKRNEDKLIVLAFPCNQFGKQEPGDEKEIKDFCNLRFNISFPLFEKVEVNGPNTHPVFTFLKEALPGLMGSQKIKWNFTKFLIDEDGKPIKRYAPTTTPEKIENDL